MAGEELVAEVLAAASHHERLGLPTEFTEDERLVRRRYRERARRVHPDKCRHPDAPQAFRALTQALECLLDRQAQADHLHSIRRRRTSSSASSRSSSGAGGRASWARPSSATSGGTHDFARAYADAMHEARRRARDQGHKPHSGEHHRYQQHHQHHRKQEEQHQTFGHERERKRKETETEQDDEEHGENGHRDQPQFHQKRTDQEGTKRARTSQSFSFDYESAERAGGPNSRKPRPDAKQKGAGAQREAAKEKERTGAQTKKATIGWVCEECGRRFVTKDVYDRHLLFGGFNHRFRRPGRGPSSTSTPTSASSASSAPIFEGTATDSGAT